nr:ATP synthase F0 subunit 6 [Linognathus vituli]
MVTSIMSLFDPCQPYQFPLNWMVMMMSFIVIHPSLWRVGSGLSAMILLDIKALMDFGRSMILYTLFIMILSVNITGTVLSSYPLSSSALFGLSLSMSFWLAGIVRDTIKSYKLVVSHLVPETSHFAIGFALVWVEIISKFMRPVSLGVRLLANITSGHILLNLIESSLSLLDPLYSAVSLVIFLVIEGLEVAVAMVQAYIFTQLLNLYWTEISN